MQWGVGSGEYHSGSVESDLSDHQTEDQYRCRPLHPFLGLVDGVASSLWPARHDALSVCTHEEQAELRGEKARRVEAIDKRARLVW